MSQKIYLSSSINSNMNLLFCMFFSKFMRAVGQLNEKQIWLICPLLCCASSFGFFRTLSYHILILSWNFSSWLKFVILTEKSFSISVIMDSSCASVSIDLMAATNNNKEEDDIDDDLRLVISDEKVSNSPCSSAVSYISCIISLNHFLLYLITCIKQNYVNNSLRNKS